MTTAGWVCVCVFFYSQKNSGEMNFPLKGSPVPLPIFQIPCEKFRGVGVSNHPRGVCHEITERFPYIFVGRTFDVTVFSKTS